MKTQRIRSIVFGVTLLLASIELSASGPVGVYALYRWINVPPGNCKVFAWENAPPNYAWENAEFMSKIDDRGQHVTVSAAGVVNLQIQTIP